MIGQPYTFLTKEHIKESNTLFYLFLSQSSKAIIPKAVAFTPIIKNGEKYFNWGFGDVMINPVTDEYYIDDKTESNNGDVKTVFYTVVSTLSGFFELYPNAAVYLEGSNEQRMHIYRNLISRHWNQIQGLYHIRGSIKGSLQLFESNMIMTTF